MKIIKYELKDLKNAYKYFKLKDSDRVYSSTYFEEYRNETIFIRGSFLGILPLLLIPCSQSERHLEAHKNVYAVGVIFNSWIPKKLFKKMIPLILMSLKVFLKSINKELTLRMQPLIPDFDLLNNLLFLEYLKTEEFVNFKQTFVMDLQNYTLNSNRKRILKKVESDFIEFKVNNDKNIGTAYEFISRKYNSKNINISIPLERLKFLIFGNKLNYKLFELYKDNSLVGAGFGYLYKNYFRISVYACDLEIFGSTEVFILNVIEYLKKHNCNFLDLGSCVNSLTGEAELGLVQYKKSFGAKQIECPTIKL